MPPFQGVLLWRDANLNMVAELYMNNGSVELFHVSEASLLFQYLRPISRCRRCGLFYIRQALTSKEWHDIGTAMAHTDGTLVLRILMSRPSRFGSIVRSCLELKDQ